jgi:hypothetical protein
MPPRNKKTIAKRSKRKKGAAVGTLLFFGLGLLHSIIHPAGSRMIGKQIEFNDKGVTRKGMISDKVNAPIASGTNEYTEQHEYIVIQDDGMVHNIKPYQVTKVIDPLKA